MKRVNSTVALAILFFAIQLGESRSENWPQFRGPNSTGASRESGLPTEWDAKKNVAWKVAIPGRAWSSPIVWEDKIFVTNAVGEKDLEKPKAGLYFGGERRKPRDVEHTWELICLGRDDGKIIWRKSVRRSKPTIAIHIKNSYASETPVTDGKRIYAYFGSAGLYCYDFDGNELWNKDLGTYRTKLGWGTGSSPAIDDARVFVQCDNEEDSFLLALDKTSGDEIWRKPRNEKSNWGTPFLWRTKLRNELVTVGTMKARSYDPETGKLLWELSGNSVISVPTPVASEELLYVSSGYVLDLKKPIYAVRPGASGDISLKAEEEKNDSIAWVQRREGPYNPSPLLYDGHLYVLYDRGYLACFDAKTGERLYKKRVQGGGPGFTASPWAYDDKVFCLNEDGETFVVEAGPEFKLLGSNPLSAFTMATPAISQGSLFIRTIDHLYCVRNAE
jgi:outer membrane protein assembly factor BamB